MTSTPLPASVTAPSPTLKRLASSPPGCLPAEKTGRLLPVRPGRFQHFRLDRGRLLLILPVFKHIIAPGRLP